MSKFHFKKRILKYKNTKNYIIFFICQTFKSLAYPVSKTFGKKTPDCIRKTCKNPGKIGKTWKKSEFFRKCAE